MIEQLKQILGKVLPGVDMTGITHETKLKEDLGFDSLALMMLAMEIEDTFNLQFTELIKFETVGDVCAYLEAHV